MADDLYMMPGDGETPGGPGDEQAYAEQDYKAAAIENEFDAGVHAPGDGPGAEAAEADDAPGFDDDDDDDDDDDGPGAEASESDSSGSDSGSGSGSGSDSGSDSDSSSDNDSADDDVVGAEPQVASARGVLAGIQAQQAERKAEMEPLRESQQIKQAQQEAAVEQVQQLSAAEELMRDIEADGKAFDLAADVEESIDDQAAYDVLANDVATPRGDEKEQYAKQPEPAPEPVQHVTPGNYDEPEPEPAQPSMADRVAAAAASVQDDNKSNQKKKKKGFWSKLFKKEDAPKEGGGKSEQDLAKAGLSAFRRNKDGSISEANRQVERKEMHSFIRGMVSGTAKTAVIAAEIQMRTRELNAVSDMVIDVITNSANSVVGSVEVHGRGKLPASKHVEMIRKSRNAAGARSVMSMFQNKLRGATMARDKLKKQRAKAAAAKVAKAKADAKNAAAAADDDDAGLVQIMSHASRNAAVASYESEEDNYDYEAHLNHIIPGPQDVPASLEDSSAILYVYHHGYPSQSAPDDSMEAVIETVDDLVDGIEAFNSQEIAQEVVDSMLTKLESDEKRLISASRAKKRSARDQEHDARVAGVQKSDYFFDEDGIESSSDGGDAISHGFDIVDRNSELHVDARRAGGDIANSNYGAAFGLGGGSHDFTAHVEDDGRFSFDEVTAGRQDRRIQLAAIHRRVSLQEDIEEVYEVASTCWTPLDVWSRQKLHMDIRADRAVDELLEVVRANMPHGFGGDDLADSRFDAVSMEWIDLLSPKSDFAVEETLAIEATCDLLSDLFHALWPAIQDIDEEPLEVPDSVQQQFDVVKLLLAETLVKTAGVVSALNDTIEVIDVMSALVSRVEVDSRREEFQERQVAGVLDGMLDKIELLDVMESMVRTVAAMHGELPSPRSNKGTPRLDSSRILSPRSGSDRSLAALTSEYSASSRLLGQLSDRKHHQPAVDAAKDGVPSGNDVQDGAWRLSFLLNGDSAGAGASADAPSLSRRSSRSLSFDSFEQVPAHELFPAHFEAQVSKPMSMQFPDVEEDMDDNDERETSTYESEEDELEVTDDIYALFSQLHIPRVHAEVLALEQVTVMELMNYDKSTIKQLLPNRKHAKVLVKHIKKLRRQFKEKEHADQSKRIEQMVIPLTIPELFDALGIAPHVATGFAERRIGMSQLAMITRKEFVSVMKQIGSTRAHNRLRTFLEKHQRSLRKMRPQFLEREAELAFSNKLHSEDAFEQWTNRSADGSVNRLTPRGTNQLNEEFDWDSTIDAEDSSSDEEEEDTELKNEAERRSKLDPSTVAKDDMLWRVIQRGNHSLLELEQITLESTHEGIGNTATIADTMDTFATSTAEEDTSTAPTLDLPFHFDAMHPQAQDPWAGLDIYESPSGTGTAAAHLHDGPLRARNHREVCVSSQECAIM
jgi:hypothetical protein